MDILSVKQHCCKYTQFFPLIAAFKSVELKFMWTQYTRLIFSEFSDKARPRDDVILQGTHTP